MKNMRMHFGKRMFMLVIVCAMVVGVALASEDTALPQAAIRDAELLKFRAYYTYTDSEVGEASFSVVSEHEGFAKKQAESKESSALRRSGIVILSMRVDVNRADATVVPFLRIQYQYKKTSNMHSATIQVGNEQYDFPLYSLAESASGGLAWEEYIVPLSEAGLDMVGKLLNVPEFQLILHGDNVYRTTIKAQPEAKSIRDQIESGAYQSIGQVYDDLVSMGMLEYRLWTRNLHAIRAILPEYRESMWNVSEIPTLSEQERAMLSVFGDYTTLALGDKGEAVRALEEKLIELGVLNGKAQSNYNAATCAAVKWAQEYYHLPATGCTDFILLSRLYGLSEMDMRPGEQATASEKIAVTKSMAASKDIVYSLPDVSISFMDYWFAKELYPSRAEIDAAMKSTWDDDLCFLIVRGRIGNASEREWTTGDTISGYILVNERFRYTCTFEVEADGGRSFSSRVLPLGEEEVLAYATVPRVLMKQKNDISFEVIAGKEALTLTYMLE